MICEVVCLTCGQLIGDKAIIYRTELKKKIADISKKNNINVTKVLTDPTIELDCSELFDKMNLESDCCRIHMSMAMYFTDYY